MSWYNIYKQSAFFYDQTFSDDKGTWNVPDIFDYAKKHGKRTNIPIEKLLHNLEPSPHETGDELPGHPDFIERSNAADISYPIIVVRYPDGLWIADGVHRLWQAREKGLTSMDAYLIDESDLGNINELV
jgi:hypothetical protein